MELKDTWVDKINDVDDVNADDINEIAQAVIQIEGNKTTSISENPSDTKYPTENAVADYVAEQVGGSSIEIVDNLISTDKNKALSANMGRELFETKVDKIENMGLSEILAVLYYAQNPATGAEESSLNIVDQNRFLQEIVFYNKEQIDNKMGDIETALDNIIAIQNELIGGENV